jgi:glycerol-3-phosphate acyltransferase PlsY
MDIVATAAVVLIAYFLGTIPFGLLIARLYGISDIRKHGSGNIGATNVWRLAGPKAAVWVYILDIGKGAAAVSIARLFHPDLVSHDVLLVIAAVSVVLGNIFPFYLKFKGGKGVNTTLGAIVSMLPIEALICLGLFAIIVSLTRYISLGSIIGACALFPVLLVEKYLFDKPVAMVYLYLSILIALVILVTHRQNIVRLLSGTENRFSFSSKSHHTGSDV